MLSTQRVKSHFCIGYGGAPLIEPPGHTLASLKKAIEIGASMLHVEIRAAREGELIVTPSAQRAILDEAVFLSDHTLEEWREITAQDNCPILALDDLLPLARQTGCGLLLDLREPKLENMLARKLRASEVGYGSLLVATDSDLTRQILRSLDPRLAVAHRFRMDALADVNPALLHKLDTDAVVWPSQVITRNVCRVLKAKGVMVYSGVVNLAQEMRRLVSDCSIDGISTPYPDLLMALRKDRAA